MKILVIGQGGREHAIVKELASSPQVEKVFVAPGNGGMSEVADVVDLNVGDHQSLAEWCKRESIQLVVVGPEAELVAGIADRLRAQGIAVFGPSREAAQLEGSKTFAKDFMKEFKVPTAPAVVVRSWDEIESKLNDFTPPYVLKADGLAAGKGVFICENVDELKSAAESLFVKKSLGDAGASALLEQFMPGRELSWLVITNGQEFSTLPLCRDHKRLKDGDAGPNTGGMGVVGPIELADDLRERIEREVIEPSIRGLSERKMLYRGVLYVGLMLTEKGPSVLEYNVRFGDPECQVIMPLLHGDWAEVFYRVAQGEAPRLNWRDEYAACVVLAAEGYPEKPVKGVKIEGEPLYSGDEGYFLHAGTRREGKTFYTNGGRVLNAVGTGGDLLSAIKNAYSIAKRVHWRGMQLRTDIGKSAL